MADIESKATGVRQNIVRLRTLREAKETKGAATHVAPLLPQ